MINWSPDPILVQIGPLAIRWYSLAFLAAFAFGFQYLKRAFIRNGTDPEEVQSLLMYVVVGTMVGARLGHCLFYEPGVYLRDPVRLLYIWRGGLASHGAAIGILTALALFCRRHRDVPFRWILDRIVAPVALAGAFIRIGNLFNSEIVGEPTTVPWAFVFERVDELPRHPTQIYESFAYGLIALVLFGMLRNKDLARRPLLTFGAFLVLTFGFRFGIEFLKADQVAFESALPLNMGQMLSVPCVLVGAWFFVRAFVRRDAADPADPARVGYAMK